MWDDLQWVETDVMHSGYWLILCLDIQQSWELCRDEETVPSEIVYEFVCPDGEDFEDETEEDRKARCHVPMYENYCRNHMLQYFAQMRQT